MVIISLKISLDTMVNPLVTLLGMMAKSTANVPEQTYATYNETNKANKSKMDKTNPSLNPLITQKMIITKAINVTIIEKYEGKATMQ